MDAPHRLQLLTTGDLLLDVLVSGAFGSEHDDAGVVQLYPGGSAANFAAGAAGLGADVRFVGCVGGDAAGRLLVENLRESGVTTCVRVIPGASTGTVLVMRDLDRATSRMWSDPAASALTRPSDFDPSWFTGLNGFHLTGYSLMRPGPQPAALHALDLARAKGNDVFRSLDPNPAHLLAEVGPDWFRSLIAPMSFDLLLPNLEEGRLLAGVDNPDEIVDRLSGLVPLVLLKLGADGCLLAWEGERRYLPAVPVNVIDTTGAGDAFAAGFVVEYLTSRDPVAAAEAANRAAASVVCRPGSR
ncbi:MAG: carbohydrate kinase family protein [Chloroflexia bacterium]